MTWGDSRHRWVCLLLGAVFVSMSPEAVSADPPGPTDYRTDVVAITPPVPGLAVGIVGGDSFVRLDVDPGIVVDVVGYRGEPYLRFGADGIVRRNERSPTRWLNDDRYGTSRLPPEADADAEPRWTVVGDGGSHLWHDHRAHWMSEQRPPGVPPGGTVLEAVIPLLVDGVEVHVEVRSVLLAPPDRRPTVAIAAALGLAAVVAAVWRRGMLLGVLAATAMLASVVGAWSYASVPSETGPSAVSWLLPATALAAVAAAALIAHRTGPGDPRSGILLAFAGFELTLWSWLRRDALLRASLPTTAPHWLDRGAVAGAGAVGAVAILAFLASRHTGARAASPPVRIDDDIG